MIISSSVDIIVMFITFILPVTMTDEDYAAFRNSILSPILTINCTFFYEHPLYLTFLMSIQRIYAVFQPFNQHFTNGKLWGYCAIVAVGWTWLKLKISKSSRFSHGSYC